MGKYAHCLRHRFPYMSKKHLVSLIILLLSAAVVLALYSRLTTEDTDLPAVAENNETVQDNTGEPKKILFIDSYHEGYDWSDGIVRGAQSILLKADDIELKITRMDSKRKKTTEDLQASVQRVRALIDSWNPDIIIAADDNASKYIIAPYFRNGEIPVVFCGINFDASEYGFPTENITGMIEVDHLPQLIQELQKNAAGKRIGFLAGDNFSERKYADVSEQQMGFRYTRKKFASSFDEWKEMFLQLQSEVDAIIILSTAGITDFDMHEATDFVYKNNTIPTGTTMKMLSPLALVSYAKVPEEFGEWAATRALQILYGISPGSIPVEYNKKSDIYLNELLAHKMGILFEKTLVETSSLTNEYDEYSSERIAALDYTGKTLNILTHEMPVIGEPTVLHARQFEKLTGIKINIHHFPFNKLYQEAILGLKSSKYDIVFYSSLWIADTYEFLEPVPERLLQSKAFRDIVPHYQSMAKWGDITYQVTIDGDRHYLQYRKDLFEDPRYQERYKTIFGLELNPPKTWEELTRIARFFNLQILDDGKFIYGITEITDKDDLLFSQFIKRAAPYAKHPDIDDGFYFDLETMKPLINTPGFVAALTLFCESQSLYPPGGKKFSLTDVTKSFGRGEAVFSDSWDDSFIKAMEPTSPIADKVATIITPGSKKVWNRKTGVWDNFEEINYAPYIAWGWTSGVSRNSRNKEAAFNFLGFFTNNKNHYSDLLVGRFGLNPYRVSDYNTSFWTERAGWKKDAAESYVMTLRQMAASDNWVMDLRIHQGRQYMEALSTGVFRALTGRETPQKALDEVARRWEIITERVGRDKQREAYSHIVRLENSKLGINIRN